MILLPPRIIDNITAKIENPAIVKGCKVTVIYISVNMSEYIKGNFASLNTPISTIRIDDEGEFTRIAAESLMFSLANLTKTLANLT